MVAESSNAASAAVSLCQKVNRMIAGGSHDYNSWRSLILEIETACPEDINAISLVYDSFLSKFPLCNWRLEKYASYKAKLCSFQEAINVYEQGAGTAMYSVGFWVDYFTFGASCFEDPEDVRRLFRRAESFVGRDYYCHVLWDKYMKYEFNQEGWSFLALSYIQVLRFPTKKLQFYYDNFKQFVANLEEETELEKGNNMEVDQPSGTCASTEISKGEISLIIKDLLDSSDRAIKSKALARYRAIGEEFYKEACQMEGKIACFEKKILRRYFYITPLDDDQLNNWHLYLDFIEEINNLDWAVKLYERCLIPCANYPEFWMRYVEFLESEGGRELAISALDRAAGIFLKNVPELHLFSARFKEHIGDANGARAVLLLIDANTDSSFIEKTVALANLEKRLGNGAAASATYEKALETAREKRRLHVLPFLYTRFAHLTFLISGSAAAARDVLIEGVRHVPQCRFLLEELIKFAMTHEGASHLNVIDAIMADATSPGSDEYKHLNAKDRENLSNLFLEYVNLCGTISDVRKAWNRHVKLFPQSLRMRAAYGVTAKKGNSDSQTSGNLSSGNHLELQAQEQAEIHPREVYERLLPNNTNAKETVLEKVSPEAIVSFNQDASESSRQSTEDNLGRIVFTAELPDQSRENAVTVYEPDQNPASKALGTKNAEMDVGTEIVKQPNENILIPHERIQEADKSSEATEPVRPDSGHEFRQEEDRVSLDNSLNPPEKEPQGSVPMPTESIQNGTSNADFNSFAVTNSVHAEDEQNELVRDKSVSHQQNTPAKRRADPDEPSNPGDNSIELDNRRPPGTGYSTSHFPEQLPGQESKLEQLGAVQEDKATDKDLPPSNTTPSTNASLGQPPMSSQPISYSTADMNQITAQHSQHPWQTEQSLAMNQMLQYHYQQQQLLQHQYQQQQLQMQQAYFQLQQNYQQFYQHLQPQVHNQQHQPQPMNQQQLQPSPYQASYQLQQNLPAFQQPQQQFQQQIYQQNQQQYYQLNQQQVVGQLQVQQGQETPPSIQQTHANQQLQVQQGQETPLIIQQTHANQQQQAQDLAYQTHQLAYQQHASQAQQLLLQQYQQYQAYQHMQQQQSQEGPNHMQEQHLHQHPVQKQQDEALQQHHQVLSTSVTQHTSQNQQGSRNAPPDYDGAAKPSESPHLPV